MKCRKCLRAIETDSRFCRHCGGKVARVIGAGVSASSVARAAESAVVGSVATATKRSRNAIGGAVGESVGGSEARSTAGADATLPGRVRADSSPTGDVYRDSQFEQTIWQGRPAWRASFGAWMAWMGLSAASLYGASRYTMSDSSLVQVVWIFVIGAAVTLLAREAMVIFGLSYHLTTQRLFMHRGLLTRVTDQLELLRIDDVRLVQGVVDRLMNTGSVEVFTTDATDENTTLQSILAPVEVAEAIRLHARGARGKGTLAVERL